MLPRARPQKAAKGTRARLAFRLKGALSRGRGAPGEVEEAEDEDDLAEAETFPEGGSEAQALLLAWLRREVEEGALGENSFCCSPNCRTGDP